MHRVRSATLLGNRMRIASSTIALLAAARLVLADAAPSPTLDRIKQAGRIKIGYRDDARPFSYRDQSGNPAGYSVALGLKVAEATKIAVGLDDLPIEWVPVTAENRFRLLQQGDVDLVCGADTQTLTRRKEVSFSIPIFPGGIGALLRADAPSQLKAVLSGDAPKTLPAADGTSQTMEAKTFAVVGGTTSETWLKQRLTKFGITADMARVEGYEAGVQHLLARKADVFFGDRAILLDAVKRSNSERSLSLLNRILTYEPLALTVARGDEDFRLVVDRTLSQLYRTGQINEIYAKFWGEPSASIRDFFEWNTLPDGTRVER